jgi:hypothetical protein
MVKTSIFRLGARRLVRALLGALLTRAFSARALPRERPAEEEALPAAFQADVLLPEQWYGALKRKQFLQGEKLLAFTLLEQSIEDYKRYLNSPTRRGQQRFREAEEWIDHQDELWFFSFDNVCAALDIEPEYLREGLHRWKLAHLAQDEEEVQAAKY